MRASPNAPYHQDGGDFTPDADFCNMRALTVALAGHYNNKQTGTCYEQL